MMDLKQKYLDMVKHLHDALQPIGSQTDPNDPLGLGKTSGASKGNKATDSGTAPADKVD